MVEIEFFIAQSDLFQINEVKIVDFYSRTLTPSMPRKSERLVRNSFFILRVEFNLLSGSGGGFSSSLMSTGGGGGFSFGGSTLVGGFSRKG